MELVKAITEKTFLPLSLVISLIGGIAWLTSLHNDTVANGAEIARIETKMEAIEKIQIDIATMKTQLQIIQKNTSLDNNY